MWRLWWDGERRKLNLLPLSVEEDEEEGEKEEDEKGNEGLFEL